MRPSGSNCPPSSCTSRATARFSLSRGRAAPCDAVAIVTLRHQSTFMCAVWTRCAHLSIRSARMTRFLGVRPPTGTAPWARQARESPACAALHRLGVRRATIVLGSRRSTNSRTSRLRRSPAAFRHGRSTGSSASAYAPSLRSLSLFPTGVRARLAVLVIMSTCLEQRSEAPSAALGGARCVMSTLPISLKSSPARCDPCPRRRRVVEAAFLRFCDREQLLPVARRTVGWTTRMLSPSRLRDRPRNRAAYRSRAWAAGSSRRPCRDGAHEQRSSRRRDLAPVRCR